MVRWAQPQSVIVRLTGAEEGLGLAKVGQGARGAHGAGVPRSSTGPAPRSAGTKPFEHGPRGRIVVEAGGGRLAVPSRPNQTRTGSVLFDIPTDKDSDTRKQRCACLSCTRVCEGREVCGRGRWAGGTWDCAAQKRLGNLDCEFVFEITSCCYGS